MVVANIPACSLWTLHHNLLACNTLCFDRNLSVLPVASIFGVEESKMMIVIIPAMNCKSYVAFVCLHTLLCYAYRSENHLQLFKKN
jgi:hypothetical protein